MWKDGFAVTEPSELVQAEAAVQITVPDEFERLEYDTLMNGWLVVSQSPGIIYETINALVPAVGRAVTKIPLLFESQAGDWVVW